MSHYLVGVIVDDISHFTSQVEEILAPYDENMKVEPYISKTKAELIADGRAHKEDYSHRDSKDIQDWMKPYLKANTDEELYKLEIEDYKEDKIDKDGNVLSTYNPKSKWDWYSIGGRWNDGNNVIQIKDLKLYNEIDDVTRKMYEEAWHCFETNTELSEEVLNKLFDGFNMWKGSYYIERYGTCDNWIKQNTSNLPYAFVDANGWYEKGQMGWFGCDNATQESIDSYTEFAEKYFTADENKDKYIVWVDCHI